jgi:outer membrane protein
MRRILVLSAVLAMMMAVPAHALTDFEIGARGMYWFPDLSANVQTFTGGIAETDIDVKSDLNVQDDDFPSGEVFLRFGRVHFRVGYTPLEFEGSKTLTRQIVFDGQTYAVGDDVVSQVDLKMLDGEVQFDLVRPDLLAASVNFGILLKVKYVDGSAEIRSTAATRKKDFTAPVPMIGAAAGVGFLKDMLRVDARASGIGYSGNHLFEGDAYASFAPLPFVRIQGGYKLIDLKIDEDDIVAELELKGPYVGAQISF